MSQRESITVRIGDPPLSCQHHHINNDTWQCTECDEYMITQHREAEVVLDAPNAAACTNPACSGDIEDPNCWNPGGIYVPDRSRERQVVIGWNFTYECVRCQNNRTAATWDNRGVTWPCGGRHWGQHVAVTEGSASGRRD